MQMMSDAGASRGGMSAWGVLLIGLVLLLVAAMLLSHASLRLPQQQVAEATTTPLAQCPAKTDAGAPVVLVNLSRSQYPQTTGHIDYARTVKGKPFVLTIDRPGKNKRSAAALAPYKPKSGFDRDEYPPAIALEGGNGADVAYISPADNEGAGASMGNQLRPYANGTKFCIQLVP